MTYDGITAAAAKKGLEFTVSPEGDYFFRCTATHEVYGYPYCDTLVIAQWKLETALPIKAGEPNRERGGRDCYPRDGWQLRAVETPNNP